MLSSTEGGVPPVVHKRANTSVRQKQIVEAARKLIIKYGSEHLTVSRIAKEIHISEGAIYRHFKSKKQILAFLLENTETNLLSDLALEQVKPPITLDSISATLKSHLEAIERRHGSSFQVIAEIVSFGDRKLNKKTLEIINNYLRQLESLLSAGIKSGAIRSDIDPRAIVLILFGMMNSLVNLWALSDYKFKLQDEYLPLWNSLRRVIEK